MNTFLPKTVEIGDCEQPIRWNWQSAVDTMESMDDPEISGQERTWSAFKCFYPGLDEMSPVNWGEALERLIWFINGGETSTPDEPKRPKLVDWEQDLPLIVAAVNRILGTDVRGRDDIHWWTFLTAYQEIPDDCTFAQVVGIRYKLSRHKPLDKGEREWYRNNRRLVDMKRRFTAEEEDLTREWIK